MDREPMTKDKERDDALIEFQSAAVAAQVAN